MDSNTNVLPCFVVPRYSDRIHFFDKPFLEHESASNKLRTYFNTDPVCLCKEIF